MGKDSSRTSDNEHTKFMNDIYLQNVVGFVKVNFQFLIIDFFLLVCDWIDITEVQREEIDSFGSFLLDRREFGFL